VTTAPPAWTCAFCGRTVPGRVDECYCGRKRTAAQPASTSDRPRRRPLVWIAALAIALIVGGAVSYFLNRKPADTPPVPVTSEAAQPVPLPSSNDPAVTAPVPDDVVKTALAALVQVEAANGRATGFFSAADVVTTSRAILGNGTSAFVTLPDGRQLDAVAIAAANQYRLVRLRVASSSPSWLPDSPMHDTRSAESVVRLAWPQVAARGVIKGLLRDQGVELFQTDLPVHTEDEGSPLVDHTGRVVGVVAGGRIVSFDSAQPYFR
jgi:S1-C subfamily serine protease